MGWAAQANDRSVDVMNTLSCIVCHSVFDFAAGESALVLRHVAYGFDFVHEGGCHATANEWIFPEPGYDCAAFARDTSRRRILSVEAPHWVLVEHYDGTISRQAVVRDEEWLHEPGGADFQQSVRAEQPQLSGAMRRLAA